MSLGSRIRQARLAAGLTQAQLAGDTVTRNMLSLIENDAAEPSVRTVQALAGRLGLPVGYFFEETNDAFFHRKAGAMQNILARLRIGDYATCIELCAPFAGHEDDELHLILCECFTRLGVDDWYRAQPEYAHNAWVTALRHAAATVYPTAQQECICRFFLAYVPLAARMVGGFLSDDPIPCPEAPACTDRCILGELQYTQALLALHEGRTEAATAATASESPVHPVQKLRLRALLLRLEDKVPQALECLRDADLSRADALTCYAVWHDREEYYLSLLDYDRAYQCRMQYGKWISAVRTAAKEGLEI